MSPSSDPRRWPDHIEITQDDLAGPVQLTIDGQVFPWFTLGGYKVVVEKGSIIGVTVTIPVSRIGISTAVEIPVDDRGRGSVG